MEMSAINFHNKRCLFFIPTSARVFLKLRTGLFNSFSAFSRCSYREINARRYETKYIASLFASRKVLHISLRVESPN